MTIIRKTFTGICAKDVDVNPPNVQVAVGPSSILNAVCWRTALYNKMGVLLCPAVNGRTFFQSAGDNIEPRCLYHPIFKRFGLFSDTEEGLSAIISNSSLPYQLQIGSGSDYWSKVNQPGTYDEVMLGYCADGWRVNFGSPSPMIKVDANNVPSVCSGMGTGVTATGLAVPAQMPDSVTGEPYWMAKLIGGGRLNVWRMDALPDDGTAQGQEYDVVVMNTDVYTVARQPGGVITVGPPEGHFIVRKINGKNYGFFTTQCGIPNTGTAAVFWCVLDLSGTVLPTPRLVYQGLLGGVVDCWNPSCSVDANGNMGLSYLMSGPTQFIQHRVGVLPWSTSGVSILGTPVASTNLRGERGGDYSGCCVDPTDNSFWAVNEVPNDAGASPNYNWTSQIVNFSFLPPSPPLQTISGTLKIGNQTLTFTGTGTIG